MKKRPGFKAMVITADEGEEEQVFKSSLSVTAGGSLQVRDFHINKLGMTSGITLDELQMDKELGRGASSVVYKAVHTPTGQNVACKMLTNVWDKELRKQLVAEMQFLKPKLRGMRPSCACVCVCIAALISAGCTAHLPFPCFVVLELLDILLLGNVLANDSTSFFCRLTMPILDTNL